MHVCSFGKSTTFEVDMPYSFAPVFLKDKDYQKSKKFSFLKGHISKKGCMPQIAQSDSASTLLPMGGGGGGILIAHHQTICCHSKPIKLCFPNYVTYYFLPFCHITTKF